MIKGNIFITGGAGFLGRGIIKRSIDEKWDCSITVFSRDEVKHAKIKQLFPDVKTIRGDVGGDFDHLVTAMTGHDIVIHAAATKIIPIAEFNVVQTIRDNVIGSLNVAQAACIAGVKKVVGTSTDKTCHPANTYGATKFLMERIFQEAQGWGYDTDFYLTRYGNVLDSTASVLGIWEQQYREQNKINITDPGMTRFWLSVDQAVDLIILALKENPGTVTIPMLPSLKMSKMAEYLYPDIEQNIIGIRPGEKLHEELLTKEETYRAINYDQARCFLLYPSGIDANFITVQDDKNFRDGYSSDNAIHELSRGEFFEMVNQ